MQSTGTCGPNADKIWLYEWNAAGHLSRVIRPDGQVVEFAYDALGRRVAKTFAGRTTRWVWDGNLPLHEWQEETGIILDVEPPPAYEMDARLAEVLQLLRDKTLSPLSPQGPPPRPSEQSPITWLFEPDSFAPMARLQGERRESIVCDHLGTPLAMFNDAGDQTWSLDLDIYGQPRMVEGERTLCPFRYPGQYEDAETGLYYNRFRYFDPEAGGYISQDPIRLEGGNPTLYGYVGDPNGWVDPWGLALSLPRELFSNGNTKILQNYGDLSREHADPIHFHVEENGKLIAKIKADGRVIPGEGALNKEAKELLAKKQTISKLRNAEKKITKHIRASGGMAGGRPFKPGRRGAPKNGENVDHLESHPSNFDCKSIASRFLRSFDHKNLQWEKTIDSKETRKLLVEYISCPQKLSDILVEIPQNLRFGALEMILRNDEASIEQLNNLTSFLANKHDLIDGRIAEVAFLIRSEFLQATNTNKQLSAFELFPFHPSYSFHTALFVAKGFVESGRMHHSELSKIQREFEKFRDDRERSDE